MLKAQAISRQAAVSTDATTYSVPFSLPPEWYYDPEIYRREAESVFYGSWRLAAHQSELASPGDFVTVDFCDESLLVVRGQDGELRGFYNVCQHRGHRLIEARRGNLEAAAVICPYHAWTYDLDGRLRAAPNCDKVAGFDKRRVRLSDVRVEEFGGFVWANCDLEADPVETFAPGLDDSLRRYVPDLDEAIFFDGDFTRLPCNWKAVADNSLDTYHFPYAGPAHRQLLTSLKFEDFTREVHDNWVVAYGPPGDPDPGGYPLDLSKSRGEIDGTVIIWIYPDVLISTLPVTRSFFIYITPPFGPESTGVDYSYYGHPEVRDLPITRTAMDWINKSVGAEDNHQVTSVHAGNKSRGFKGAHFMVDTQHSRLSEHPGTAFHRRIHEVVTGAQP